VKSVEIGNEHQKKKV